MNLSKAEEEYKVIATEYWTQWYENRATIPSEQIKGFMQKLKELRYRMQIIMDPTKTRSKTSEWERSKGVYKEIDRLIKKDLA